MDTSQFHQIRWYARGYLEYNSTEEELSLTGRLEKLAGTLKVCNTQLRHFRNILYAMLVSEQKQVEVNSNFQKVIGSINSNMLYNDKSKVDHFNLQKDKDNSQEEVDFGLHTLTPEMQQFKKLIGELAVDLRENVEMKISNHLKMLVSEEEEERIALGNISKILEKIAQVKRN